MSESVVNQTLASAGSTGYISDALQTKPERSEANFPPVLDATCGTRAMWFNKTDPRAVFFDCRDETIVVRRGLCRQADATLHIRPDVRGSFAKMPFPSAMFYLVVFDPPHYEKIAPTANLAKYYGRLFDDWETEMAAGFKECFRVLRDNGVLVFKWSSIQIPLARVLDLAPCAPLFGHIVGRREKTHWMTFIKHTGAAAPATQKYNEKISHAAENERGKQKE